MSPFLWFVVLGICSYFLAIVFLLLMIARAKPYEDHDMLTHSKWPETKEEARTIINAHKVKSAEYLGKAIKAQDAHDKHGCDIYMQMHENRERKVAEIRRAFGITEF